VLRCRFAEVQRWSRCAEVQRRCRGGVERGRGAEVQTEVQRCRGADRGQRCRQRCRGTDVQMSCRGEEVKRFRFRGSEVQRFIGAEVLRCRVAELQRCRFAEVQWCKFAEVQV